MQHNKKKPPTYSKNKKSPMPASKPLETAVTLSPLVLAVGVGALAASTYLAWLNRYKIKKFIQDQEMPEVLTNLGEYVSDGATQMTQMLGFEENSEPSQKFASK